MKVTQSLKENPNNTKQVLYWYSLNFNVWDLKWKDQTSVQLQLPPPVWIIAVWNLTPFLWFQHLCESHSENRKAAYWAEYNPVKKNGEDQCPLAEGKKKQPKTTQPLHNNTSTFVFIIFHLDCILDDSKNSWFPLTENILCFEDMFLISRLV